MIEWWRARAPRERLLLIAGAIAAAFALAVQFVLVPALQSRDRALGALAESEGTMARLQRLQSSGATYRVAADATSTANPALRAAVFAEEMGLVRQSTDVPKDSPAFTFPASNPTVVFAWLERVETELGIAVGSANLTSVDSGLINAEVVLADGSEP